MSISTLKQSTIQLAQQAVRSRTSIEQLQSQLRMNSSSMRKLMGSGSGGEIGQLLVMLQQCEADLDRVKDELRRVKTKADEYASHLAKLGG